MFSSSISAGDMPGENEQDEIKKKAKKFSLRKNFTDNFIKCTFGFRLVVNIICKRRVI